MKRFLAVMLAVSAVFWAASAYSEIVRDAELGKPYRFKGNAKVTLTDFSFVTKIAADEGDGISCARDEEIALLKADITNLRKESFNFGDVISVNVIYYDDGDYLSYRGAAGQYSFNNPEKISMYLCDYNPWIGGFIYRTSFYPIGARYTRSFAFYCALPKAVVHDEASPLQMIIKIGDDELVYNIRK